MRIFIFYCSALFLLFIPVFYFRYIAPSDYYRFIFLRIFLLVEFTALSLFFYYVLKSLLAKKIVLFAIIPFAILSIFDFTTSIKGTFSFVPLVVECLVILTYILYFFYEKMRSDIFTPAYQTRAFWIAVAFTLFCSGNFFLFLYSNNSVKDDLYKLQYTIIYSTFTILKNLFICIGLSIKEPTTVGSNIQHGKVDDIWEIPIDYKKTNL